MKLRILSDLHLDFMKFPIENIGEDLLIIAGDLSGKHRLSTVFIEKYLSANNNVLIFVPGNHDYYDNSIESTDEKFEKLEAKYKSRFYYLRDKHIKVGNVQFFGATLWTDYGNDYSAMDVCRSKINDYRKIIYGKHFLTPEDTINFHRFTLSGMHEFLETKDPSIPTIIITHHAPVISSIPYRYLTDELTPSFASDLEDLINNNAIDIWIHGHIHDSMDYKIRNTRILCNPRGYARLRKRTVAEENHEFNPNLIVELFQHPNHKIVPLS